MINPLSQDSLHFNMLRTVHQRHNLFYIFNVKLISFHFKTTFNLRPFVFLSG